MIVSSIGVVSVNIILALRNSSKLDQTLTKTSVIEGHVNSERAKLNEQLIAKHNEIKILTDVIANKNKTSELLAQSVAQSLMQKEKA